MKPTVFILLPVHNRRAVTERFIDCLTAQSYPTYHLVLIDDGSDDGTAQMVRAKVRNLSVIRGRGNWWWAGCLQQGVNWLEANRVDDSEIVLLMNDDVIIDKEFLAEAVRRLESLRGTLLLPQVIDKKSELPEESGLTANLKQLTFEQASSAETMNCLPTRGLFLRMGDLRRIGGFHPRMLPHYLSDYEFTIRAHRKGFRLATYPTL